MPSVTNQAKETEASDARTPRRGYSYLTHSEDKNDAEWRDTEGHGLELSAIDAQCEVDNEDTLLADLKVT